MITIIDYGLGNIGSVFNMLRKLHINATISSDKDIINKSEKLILPGVGSFDNGMSNLESMDLLQILNEKVLDKNTPVLGICLGMQLMTKSSQEGKLPGLGWINAETRKFVFSNAIQLKIPHMGWNTATPKKCNMLFQNANQEMRFYFVHSYYVFCHETEDIITETYYGQTFPSSIQHGNIYATQFHPEKSHKYGMQIFKNFAEL